VHRKQITWLAFGIGSIALVVGYMVGGSQTPVVSVAVPAVFGLVITALGFIGGSSAGKKIDEIKDLLPLAKVEGSAKVEGGAEAADAELLRQVERKLTSIKKELSLSPERIGKLLVVFTSFYVAGLAFGTYARITNLYAPSPVRQLPWADAANGRRPPTSADAIDWVTLQEQLLSLGYNKAQIAEIYSIQAEEWNRQQAASAVQPTAQNQTDQNGSAAAKEQKGDGGGHNPKLSEKLKEARGNGNGSPIGLTVIAVPSALPNRNKPTPTPTPTPAPTLDSSKLP
jgi:DNA-binding transcriptional MerR regulator